MRKSLLLSFLCLFCVFVTHAGSQIYQFATGTSTGITDDQNGTWTNGESGFNFKSNELTGLYGGSGGDNRGISANADGSSSFTSDAEFSNVTKITVDVSSNGSGNTLSVKIGNIELEIEAPDTPSIGNSNHQTKTFTTTEPLSGKITFTVSRSAKTVWIAGFEVETQDAPARDPYTVNFNAGNGSCDNPSLKESAGGAGITLPTATSSVDGWKFVGWATSSVASTETTPDLLAAGSIYVPTEDNTTLYAVYSLTVSDGAQYSTEWVAADGNLANATIWASGNIDTHTTWSATKGGSYDPRYFTKDNSLRIYNGGTYTLSSDQIIQKVILTFTKNTETFSSNEAVTPLPVENINAKEYEWKVNRAAHLVKVEVFYAGNSTTIYSSEPDAGSVPQKHDYENDFQNVEVKLEDGSFTLEVATPSPSIKYLSSDDAVVKPTEGNAFNVLKRGTATITASWDETSYWNGGSTQFNVTVTGKDFTIDGFKDYNLNINDIIVLTLPEGAPAVTYSTNNAEVAEVLDGELWAKGPGTATITATWTGNDTYNEGSKTFNVTVTAPDPVAFTFEGFKDQTRIINTTFKFELPEGAPTINYDSTNEDVVAVLDGEFMALGVGTTTITATWAAVPYKWNAGTTTFNVTVKNKGEVIVDPETLDLKVGEPKTFEYLATTDGEINVTSSDEKVATVTVDTENSTVTVTPIAAGTADITVSTLPTETYTAAEAVCKVTVKFGSQQFELVPNGDTVEEGDVIVIVVDKDNPYTIKASPLTSTGELPGTRTGFTKASDIITVDDPAQVAIFNVVKGQTVGETTYLALQYQSGEYLTVDQAKTEGFNSSETLEYANVIFEQVTDNNKKIKFVNEGRYLRGYNGNFRSYTGLSYDPVAVYRIAKEKENVTLAWDKAEATYDLDFGWDGEMPVLSSTPEVAGDNIQYSSSDTNVATVAYTVENGLTITPKAVGECEISAKVKPGNKDYKSEEVSFTLTVTGADKPSFAKEDGTAFEGGTVELLPSQLAAGYTLKVVGTEGYGLNITLNPESAGSVTISETEPTATVTVTKDCKITARIKKGEQKSTRYSSFSVATVALAPAEISWTADRYVYDFATKQWNETPSIVNDYDLPLTYKSSDEKVAKISATGEVTPVAQGTATVSATAAGTDEYSSNTITATIRVTDSNAPIGYDVFEMVKKGDQLRENEQFIIVSGEPFNSEKKNKDDYTQEGGLYYAITPNLLGQGYYEGVTVDFPEGDESGDRLLVSDESNVLRLSMQSDTSGADEDYPFLFQVMNNDPEIQGKYIQVKAARNFIFADLPENIEDRGLMNGNLRVLDPALVEGYTVEKDYYNIQISSDDGRNYKASFTEFDNKGEILFNNPENGAQYFVRFNPAGLNVHFNVYELDKSYDSNSRSKQTTFPIRIYRLANRVEKPSITVYPEEPAQSDVAYEDGVTFNNKVRVVIEQHPKTSQEASLMRQWQAAGHNPAIPDYESFTDKQVVVYVDGHKVVNENNEVVRYIDLDNATATRTLFAVSQLEDVYSESASATFNFKTSAPRIVKGTTNEDNSLNVRITRPTNFTQNAVYYYVISEDGNTKPSVTFDKDGNVTASEGTSITEWDGKSENADAGVVSLTSGQTLWVGAFKAGYQPSFVQYTNNTVFPECRPMQLLRLTDAGRAILIPEGTDTDAIFGAGNYDANKPLYINYRNDLVNEDGSLADSDNHFHYMIQRDHEYAQETNRKVWIKQISEDQFKAIFGSDTKNVDAEHAKNFQWTSDFYVFALNEADFKGNFSEEVEPSVTVVSPDKTYTALKNTFALTATNADGSFAEGAEAKEVTYYGAMLENQGKLGAKELTTNLSYTVNEKQYATEATAEIAPRIPAMFGLAYEYQYVQDENPTYTGDDTNDKFVKIEVPSAVENMENEYKEVLMPVEDLNCRHLNLVFKFSRPNISKHILANYDIYYNLEFYRVDEKNGKAETLLPGSGVYRDNEKEEGTDAVYRFRIDDVNPLAAIYPKIKLAKVTYVGNTGDGSYGQYTSNFGEKNVEAAAPNATAKKELSIGNLSLKKRPSADGKTADWEYIGHDDFQDSPDVILNADDKGNEVTISSSYYHVEAYVPGTDHYTSYEYLVKHDADSHNAPANADHPFNNQEKYDKYDALRHTLIARNVPADVKPTIVIAPVYFFGAGADLKPMPIDQDGNKIESFEDAGGHAQIEKVQDIKSEATAQAPAQAPRRADATTEKAAPSRSEYPMPHAGETDMNHESIINVDKSEYTAVKGGAFKSVDFTVTGIEDVYAPAGDGTPRYYNLQGIPVVNPDHGIYIRVVNGVSEKVIL